MIPSTNDALERLLEQRRRDDRADLVAAAVAEQRVADGRGGVVDQQRGDGGDARTPAEGEPEHARRLRLPAVDPQQRGHDHGDGHQRGDDPDQLGDQPDLGGGDREQGKPTTGEHHQARSPARGRSAVAECADAAAEQGARPPYRRPQPPSTRNPPPTRESRRAPASLALSTPSYVFRYTPGGHETNSQVPNARLAGRRETRRGGSVLAAASAAGACVVAVGGQELAYRAA